MRKLSVTPYAKKLAISFGAALNHQVGEDWLEQTERCKTQKQARALHKKVMKAVCREILKRL
jgi:hypothetical protein